MYETNNTNNKVLFHQNLKENTQFRFIIIFFFVFIL